MGAVPEEKLAFLVILLPSTIAFLVCGYRCFKRGWAEGFQSDQIVPVDIETPPYPNEQQTAEQVSNEQLRQAVLVHMFPTEQGSHLVYDKESKSYVPKTTTTTTTTTTDTSEASSPEGDVGSNSNSSNKGSHLVYDKESKSYVPKTTTDTSEASSPERDAGSNSNNNTVASPCIFCLEVFDPNANVVTAECGHSYHHKCLMEWCTRSDDCPNCRAPVWDQETFDRLMKEERERAEAALANSQGSSTRSVEQHVVRLGC
eukprot:CAMPEP_0194066896 /NCGR_PEP_ID=MMETSP0009_2-20130614/86272_1 /TAXON_ID=210454 /ORGANISM="Grammatophora oceanica, Strain CCMP 410" /LENGTH=257 /DNA_ID=CAMNT_0038719889 /DNA_START=72 /DNA_END=846 /DNA_ORIENTATION=-